MLCDEVFLVTSGMAWPMERPNAPPLYWRPQVVIVTSGMASMIGGSDNQQGCLPRFATFTFQNPRCVGSSRPGNQGDDAIADVQLKEHFHTVARQSADEDGAHFNMLAQQQMMQFGKYEDEHEYLDMQGAILIGARLRLANLATACMRGAVFGFRDLYGPSNDPNTASAAVLLMRAAPAAAPAAAPVAAAKTTLHWDFMDHR